MKKIFGIIGNPIKHSLSPVLHNYWFKKYKIDAEYSIIETTDKELNEVVKKIKSFVVVVASRKVREEAPRGRKKR